MAHSFLYGEIYMNSKNRELVAEMIAHVESNSRWNAYSDPGTISAKEHTITIGAYQFGGGSNEARDLLRLIKEDYPKIFAKYDTCGIAGTLSKDWYSTYFNPTSTQKKQIIAMISTPEGIATQKKYFCDIELPAYLKRAEEFGLKTQKCQALWVEIQHLGGLGPTKRIFNRIKAETVDEVDRALRMDQSDKSSSNQVGDWIYYKDRHTYCLDFVRKYITETEDDEPKQDDTKQTQNNTTEKATKNKTQENVFVLSDIKIGSKGNKVLLLQEILRARGFKGVDGKPLDLDREAGANTIYAINSYQNERRRQGIELGTNGKNDGTCGQKMWKDLISI